MDGETVHDADKTYANMGDGWILMQEGSVLGGTNQAFVMVTDVLTSASGAVYVGQDKVGDFETRHYEWKVDGLERNPQWGPVEGDKIVFDLWPTLAGRRPSPDADPRRTGGVPASVDRIRSR